MTMDPKRVVAEGYDALGPAYAAWVAQGGPDMRTWSSGRCWRGFPRAPASMWRDGRLVLQDEHVLKLTAYFTNELQLMLERANFIDIELRGDCTDDEPTVDSEDVVFIARKPG